MVSHIHEIHFIKLKQWHVLCRPGNNLFSCTEKPWNLTQHFCSCSGNSDSTGSEEKCGFVALTDDLLRNNTPEAVRAALPGFLRNNSQQRPRTKRSILSSTPDYTDDYDNDYQVPINTTVTCKTQSLYRQLVVWALLLPVSRSTGVMLTCNHNKHPSLQ